MPRAIEMKLTRLGVVEGERKISSTTTALKGRKLLTHKETSRLLAGALVALREPSLDNHPFSSAVELGICGVCGVHLECGGWGLNPRRPSPTGPKPVSFDQTRTPPPTTAQVL
jgi:hypothetical protein